MTLIVGLKCTDGLVLASDGMATETPPVGQGAPLTKYESAKKIVVTGDFLWGVSGSVGVRQEVQEHIAKEFKNLYKPTDSPAKFRQQLIGVIHPILKQTYERVAALNAPLLVPPGHGIPVANFVFGAHFNTAGYSLINIECNCDGDVVEAALFCTGSGAKTGQALLRRLRTHTWDVRTATVVAYRTLNDAIHVEPSGIGEPIHIAKIFKEGGKIVARFCTEAEMSLARDTARIWTETEQEALQNLLTPKQAEAPTVPVPSPVVPPAT